MALFNRKGPESSAPTDGQQGDNKRPLPGKQAHCSVCGKPSQFTNCWMRVGMVRTCTGCKQPIPNAEKHYQLQQQPACPHCGEYLEYPGFEYGQCDTCGSKFELLDGTKPSLLPNRKQRAEMDKFGRARSRKR